MLWTERTRFIFNHCTSHSNSDQGCHSRGNSDGPRGKYCYIFTLKCDSSNNRYDFGTWGSKSSPQYREFNFSYCLDTYFTLKKTVLILVFECGSSYRKFKNFCILQVLSDPFYNFWVNYSITKGLSTWLFQYFYFGIDSFIISN